MTVSVIIAVFNGMPWIDEAIRSIRDQDLRNLELVVVDDASTDATPEILARHARADDRVRLCRLDERNGIAYSRNLGIAQARYDFLAVLDADDVADRGRLSRQIEVFRERLQSGVPLGVLAAHERLIDGSGRLLSRTKINPNPASGDVTDRLRDRNCLIHSSVMMTRNAFTAAGRYRPEFVTSQDYDLWLRIAEKFRVEVLDEVLVSYRLHDRAISVARVREQIVNALRARACSVARARGEPEPLDPEAADGETLAELVGLPVSFDFYVAKELAKRARHFVRFGSPKVARCFRKDVLKLFRSTSREWPIRQRAEILLRLARTFG